MKLTDFDYPLPKELIATTPLENRSQSRLLIVKNPVEDCLFDQIINYINPEDLLVMNNTRVVKARMFGCKTSGGKVEILLERIYDQYNFVGHIKTSKAVKLGMEVILPNQLLVTVVKRLEGGLFQFTTNEPVDLYSYLEKYGNLPLPPYMGRQAEQIDEKRYQTVYAKYNGSVAAPTAGLHFTSELLAEIQAKGTKLAHITLHIGSGTFKPVNVENIAEHKMHSETYNVTQESIDLIKSAKANGGKIICVGTTSLRTLETIASRGLYAQSGETDIFITPGFKFKLADKLITNFHLPKSTLLMLVTAFAGKLEIDAAYQHAINNKYRFFSYGDAMLLKRKD